MKKIKEHKKDLILFVIVFLVSIVMCGAFLQPHYTHDTYKIARDGYELYSYDKFLKEARPFTVIMTLFASKINLSIENYTLMSFVLALVLLSVSVVIVYKLFRKQFSNDSKWNNILALLISFVTIFNYLAIEHILFLECCILALGVLLSTIAARCIINNEKCAYVKSAILIMIAVFCYQGSIAIFPMLVLTYKLLFEKGTIKSNFIEIIKIAIIYGIAMLSTILFSEFLMGGSRIRIDTTLIDIQNIFKWTKELVINSLGVIPPYVNIAIIILTTITILIVYKVNFKEKFMYTMKYLLLILASVAICIAPAVVGSGLQLTPRMCLAYGSTIGISLFTILYIIDKNTKKYQLLIFSFVTIITFILNITLYIVLTNQHIFTNKTDRENCEKIKEVVETYEAETNIKVTKIAAVWRPDKELYYHNLIHAGAITQKALNSWANRETIAFYLGRELIFAPITKEQYVKFFGNKAWNEFSTEQVVIEGDVMYFCGN